MTEAAPGTPPAGPGPRRAGAGLIALAALLLAGALAVVLGAVPGPAGGDWPAWIATLLALGLLLTGLRMRAGRGLPAWRIGLRPAPRLLLAGAAGFALSAVVLATGRQGETAAALIWLALLGLVLGDLALSLRGRARVEASLPADVFVGSEARLTLRFAPGPASAPRARVDWPDGLEGPEAIDSRPAQGGGFLAEASLRARARGHWRLEALWLTWTSRLGLFEFTPRLALDLGIAAVPDIRPVSSGRIDVDVRSALYGLKETSARGDGSEFHQLRDFTAGMDIRDIDWKRSARHRSLLAKESRAERNHNVILALDNGYQMRAEVEGLPKIDHAVHAALAVAWAAALGGDQIGLFAYDSQPRLFVPPAPGRAAFARLRRRMADLDYAMVETNHTLALSRLSARIPRRSLIVVFSDFADPTTAELLVETLGALSRRHAIVFVALGDPGLARAATARPHTLDALARGVAAAQMRAERRVVLERLHRLGIAVLDVAPGQLTARLVSAYLDLKAREVI
ncbi:DUF58 domain-containing protein [Paroceanicella profunda]|uniref:DUF58 domain-containing protein n=1 Tax=Paroceanicella profunda TaxID=2579971 RepID=A0A5B8FGD4_9RHOB|nr:DUF58 domain-containing protein [Paroceanicella profunda]QDL91051.1 DUF58 domain-containing protein [Paroceanicella profunda]